MPQPPRTWEELLRIDRRRGDVRGRRQRFAVKTWFNAVARFHGIAWGGPFALSFAPVAVVVAAAAQVVQPSAVSAIAAGVVAVAPAQAEMTAERPGIG